MNTDKQVATWMDDFIVELRLRDVRGAAIGDAVCAVQSHLAESGETPAEAFGDPREYARPLEFRPDQYDTSGVAGWVQVLAPTVCGLLGLTLTTSTVSAAASGGAVAITWGSLLGFALLAVLMWALSKRLRWVLDHMVLGAACAALAIAAMTALAILVPAAAFRLPVWGGGASALALLVASVVLQQRVGREIADPVADPLDDSDMLAAESPRLTAFLEKLQPWVFVIASMLLGALVWFTAVST